MSDTPDYRTPSPDEGHEAIRAPLAQAIDQLAEQVATTTDAMLMVSSVADLLGYLFGMVSDLDARVAALEPHAQPEPAVVYDEDGNQL